MSEPTPRKKRPSASLTQAETPSQITVLVADSYDITLAGTCLVLSRAPHIKVVARATTAADALAEADSQRIDLAILELRFTDGRGIEVCQHIRSSCPETHVIILTDTIDEESAFSALRAGAAGILAKSVEETSLVRAIEAVYAGQMIFDRRIFQPLVTHLCGLSIQACGKARTAFSHQERQVMSLVAEGKTNKEIAQVLGLTNKTVKNRLSTLYGKLQVTRRTQATTIFIEHSREDGTIGLAEFGCSLTPPDLPEPWQRFPEPPQWRPR